MDYRLSYDADLKWGKLIPCFLINSLGLTKAGDEGLLEITLNKPGLTNIQVLLHNKGQFYNPNYMNLFGSDNVDVELDNGTVGFRQKFKILRTELRSIDQPQHRCGENVGNISTTQCIMNFVRQEIGCYFPIHFMESAGLPVCSKVGQFEKLMELAYDLEHNTFTESHMYKTTGCLSPCTKV